MPINNPVHAGEILRYDVLEALGISRKTLSKICNGKGAITPEMTVRLELALVKPSAAHWLKLQTAYDLAQANKKRDQLHVQPLAA